MTKKKNHIQMVLIIVIINRSGCGDVIIPYLSMVYFIVYMVIQKCTT